MLQQARLVGGFPRCDVRVLNFDYRTPATAGNVYVKYFNEEDAMSAKEDLNGRFYAGRHICAEFSPVTEFREARYGSGVQGIVRSERRHLFLNVVCRFASPLSAAAGNLTKRRATVARSATLCT